MSSTFTQTLANKDGSKHPVGDQQEIDKQLPKAAADATPKVLTFANLSLKEPIVVTLKRVAPPVVSPEAPIDVDARKPPAVMPEEPVVATPTATSAAPPKSAPSTIPKETTSATSNETPVTAPNSSILTPIAHVATPRVPVTTSVAPDNTPRAHVVTSVAPVGIPSAPVAMPRAPVATSVAPVDTPSAPFVMPKSPTVTTPKSPAAVPSANQQQEVNNKVCYILCCHYI